VINNTLNNEVIMSNRCCWMVVISGGWEQHWFLSIKYPIIADSKSK